MLRRDEDSWAIIWTDGTGQDVPLRRLHRGLPLSRRILEDAIGTKSIRSTSFRSPMCAHAALRNLRGLAGIETRRQVPGVFAVLSSLTVGQYLGEHRMALFDRLLRHLVDSRIHTS